MSLTILVVDKNGTINEQTIKKFDEAELYKKAGLKSASGFKMHTEWVIPDLKGKYYNICLYGKTDGRANSENKYEFPPPVDNTLFFGSCILINKGPNNTYVNLTDKEWLQIYEHLYGGFEDIGDEEDDEDEDEEDEDEDDLPRTKSGYVKDDFVVDDDEEDEEEEEEEDEEEDEDEYVKPKSCRKPTTATTKKRNTKKDKTPIVNNYMSTEQGESFLECTGELSEEEYV